MLLFLSEKTVRRYIATYIKEGFSLLCKKTTHDKKERLAQQQAALFKEALPHKKSYEVALTGNRWTGALMCHYLQKTFGIVYRSGVYDLLERLGLRHQKAHADYGNAKPAGQQAFLAELEATVL